MKNKYLLALILAFVCLFNVSSLEVYMSELESAPTQEIQFNSYTGPVTVFNTMAQIRNIGTELGEQIANGALTAGEENRYYVIHATDNEVQASKLDADIFVLGKDVGVDHIRNLRAIISAYLVAAYDYSVEDADTLSVFITVYNAVYRTNIDSVKEKYKPVVLEHINNSIAGLSTEYTDWPGKTQIIIPLTGRGRGSLSAVDTTTITDEDVVENIRQDSDKGVDIRTDMKDLKEREADEAELNAQEAAKEAADAQMLVKDAQNDVREAQSALQEAQVGSKEAEEAFEMAQGNANINPDDPDARQKALDASLLVQESRKNAEDAEKALAESKEALKDAKEDASIKAEVATAEQNFADKKRQEAQDESKDIAKDNLTLPGNDKIISAAYGLKIVDKESLLSAIVLLDKDTGKELKTSSMKYIRGRNFYQCGTNFVAIAGQNGGNAAIRLVLIDGVSLEMIMQSDDTVADNAVLAEFDNNFFTVIQKNGKWLIGKYSSELDLVAISSIEVDKDTPIFATKAGVCVVDKNNNSVLLKLNDLSTF